MGKRVAVILSGCGEGDGSDTREAVLALLSLERAGADVMCFAPEEVQAAVHDHVTGAVDAAAPPRAVLAEAARLAHGRIRPLASLGDGDFDALVFPGGQGVGTVLSNYAEKGERCEVHPDVARLLKSALAKHRTIGLIGLAPILAARVLGPVAGVHITLGPRGTAPAKHAAVMGADVRPGQATDVFVDRKNRVVTTPGYLSEGIRLTDVAHAVERLVRSVMQLVRGERLAAPGADGKQPGVINAGGPANTRKEKDVKEAPREPKPQAPAILRRPGGAATRGPGSA
jgi:enhancing lycopene biosynthesis protein 2